MAEFPREQGKFYAHQETDKDLVVCAAPQRIDPPAAAAARAEAAPRVAASAAAASGYYHFSSSGVKHKSKWDDFDADAECAKLDDDDDGAPTPRRPPRAPAPARAAKPAEAPTACGACTFVNLSGAANCEMCGTALGGGDARAGFEPYTCSVCTFQNLDPKHAAACEMCGTPK